MSDGDAIQRLVDIEAIRQLKARYFRFLDTKDWDAFATVLTEDAYMEADGVVREGRAEILRFLPKVLDAVVTTHHGHTSEIEITGSNTATGIWAMFDYLTWPDGTGLQGFGHYHESYVRSGGAWKIQRLVLTRLRIDPLPGGLPS